MLKINAETFVKQLVRANGIGGALKIAEARAKNTHPSTWNNIPFGPIFYQKDKRGGDPKLDVAHLTHLHNWWNHVYCILRKRAK